MNGCNIDGCLLKEIDNYTQLTYLKKSEIIQKCKLTWHVSARNETVQISQVNHIYGRFKTMREEMSENIHHRFDRSQIMEIFPELSYNPFIDRTFQIFSSLKDDRMSFEDVLDLASAFSEDCPVEVKAKWAFLIFDFDGDNLLNRDDIVEMITRLTKMGMKSTDELDEEEKQKVADIVLRDIVLCNTDGINCLEFINIVKKIPEFMYAFRIKFS